MPQEDSTIGITTDQVTRIATEGAWDAQGQVRPEAVLLATNLVEALRTRSGAGLLPDELSELVTRTLNIAVPSFPKIRTAEGYRLSAHMLRQLTPGPHPLVVVPAGWTPVGWPLFEYAYLTLALKGYHVVAYTPRGLGWTTIPETDLPWFGTSEGKVKVAGQPDWEDGIRVLNFAIDQLQPSGVGFLGESYGSGISQLVAANDPRVDVVIALSTWGNLATSLYHNETRHLRAVAALLALTGGDQADKFDDKELDILAKFAENREMQDVVDWGTERAPERLAGNRAVPTFFSNTWHESLFPVNQVLTTFDKLSGPKRLNMWIGDHAVPEGPGLIGPGPNLPLHEAYMWLDYHLKGVENGVDGWPQVSNQVMFTYGPDVTTQPARREEQAEWSDVTVETRILHLTDMGPDGDGALGPDNAVGWERSFTVGKEPEVVSMDLPLMSTGQEEWKGNPKRYLTNEINRDHALIWTTRALAPTDSGVALRIRGIPRLRLTVDSAEEYATLVAYLLDVDPGGEARIITHEPNTIRLGGPVTVTWELQAAAYDVVDGHRVMLVIDGLDPLYSTASQTDSRITITAPAGDPAQLELPLG
ncbi:CocE/NonD family hydrolase C-terminal non-catalytic domain-containing protein [Nocardia sp. SYP-A9097]|uniref:CocE/NonD family hydrolase C-terminal non-catalytic domain-containing protein n=1 Tax=Nocardia sp. SYP-A9097 TaxID=2663237 RepID=UPI001E5A7AC6|nr:CocE/NonD family hydrolase C-terminal non-catalytic domain-containing protein [Nocardia sp. SYP-A9097]